jgi:hypothetical protein
LQLVTLPFTSADKTAIPPTAPAWGVDPGDDCGCELRFTGGIPRVWS